MSHDKGSELTEDQRHQLGQRDELVQLSMFSVDAFVMDHYDDLKRITGADHSRLIVEAAIGSLLDNGLIEAVHLVDGVSVNLPPHLVPNVAEAVARLRRLNAAAGARS